VQSRKLRVIAKDPAFRWPNHESLGKLAGEIVTYEVEVPYEDLDPGPRGARVHVIDYLIDSDELLRPTTLGAADAFEHESSEELLRKPDFHAQNVYALVSKTLARFEFALGRRMAWGFGGHQIKVIPHAFTDPNAFYSSSEEVLAFGHFPAIQPGETIFTCLSHDIIVHESTHALLDGLRGRFMVPSGPDQAAFHEGFSDLVALLSVLETDTVVKAALYDDEQMSRTDREALAAGLIRAEEDSSEHAEYLRKSVLGSIARQLGSELYGHGRALRASAELTPKEVKAQPRFYMQEHNRGEILVAAVMTGYFDVIAARLATVGTVTFRGRNYVHLARVVEEAQEVANYVLTMLIRAIDYTPPIHLTFGDFLSAVLTADFEVRPDDSKYDFREHLRRSCGAFGITPASDNEDGSGRWIAPQFASVTDGLRFESLRTDPGEVMRYVWANRGDDHLKLHPTAYTKIESLRPSVRIAPDDGFPLREIVAECIQIIELPASALGEHGVTKPEGMEPETTIRLLGGTTLIFDEFGRLKYDIHNHLPTLASEGCRERATTRLAHRHDSGGFRRGHSLRRGPASFHRTRSFGLSDVAQDTW